MVQNCNLLTREFFLRSPNECARDLIGCRFQWHGCAGVIVETEAYEAEGDPACHTDFRPGARKFVEDHEAGATYVYLNYGVHWLFNVLVKGGSRSGFVLFRALEPVEGLERMKARRNRKDPQELCSGPGKLTQALGIDGTAHGQDLFSLPHCRLRFGEGEEDPVACRRIGISKAKNRLWRYVRRGSSSVSIPPQFA